MIDPLRKARNAVEEKMVEVSEPATNFFGLLAVVGLTGAAVSGALFLIKKMSKP